MNPDDRGGINQGNAPNPRSYDVCVRTFKQDFVAAYTQNDIRNFNYSSIVHGLCENMRFEHVHYSHNQRALYADHNAILLIQTHVHPEGTTIGFQCPYFPYLNDVAGTPDRNGPISPDRIANQVKNKLESFLIGMDEYKTQDTKRFPHSESRINQAGWVCESITQ